MSFATFASVPPPSEAATDDDAAAAAKDKDGAEDEQENTENARGVTVPVLNIEPRVERGIYIFTAIGSTLLIRSLDQVGVTNSVVVLMLLIMLMMFCERIESECKRVAKKWAPRAFSSPIVVMLKIMEFNTTLSIYVTISYAISLLGTLWVDGNLTFFETAVTIVFGVAIAYTIAVAYHDVRTTLERAVAQQKKLASAATTTPPPPPPAAPATNNAYSIDQVCVV